MTTTNTSIWQRLKKPIICLAPMAGVTDSAQRQVTLRLGRPDLFFTEFVSCAGLCSDGKPELLMDLSYIPEERPIIAQIFGRDPDQFEQCAELIAEMGYDGIDINTGCPDKKVQKQGSGAMLMKEPELTKKLIAATKRGANGLPVSVKTRIGYSENNLDNWIPHLLEAEPAAISIHWRTKSQMYRGSADWTQAPKVVEMAQRAGSTALILGNGDIKTLPDAHRIAAETGVDGVMLGRAILSNPWVFNPTVDPAEITSEMRINAMLDHLAFFEETFGDRKHFLLIRKYVKSYINGFQGAKELRIALQTSADPDAMRETAHSFIDDDKEANADRRKKIL